MPDLPKGQYMWISYTDEIRRVSIICKGCGDVVYKRGHKKPKNPYVIYDEMDDEEFVMGIDDLHHNPRDATLAALVLAKEHGVPMTASNLELNPISDEEEEGEEEEEEEGGDENDEEGEEEDDEEKKEDDGL